MAYVPLADQDSEMEMHHPHSWVTKYVWSQDHKVIAIQYGGLAIAVGVVALILSLLMRMQLGFPETFDLIAPSSYYQSVTMHGMIMVVYMLTALLLGGFGNYLIPLMCGARDMVFPFLNMLSVWVYALSVIILLSSFFVGGGPTGAGWTLYPPQTALAGTPGHDMGIVLMLLSLAVFVVAFTMGGLNYVTTVLQYRCRGLTMMRLPLTVWGIFIATILGLFAFPALLVSAIMMLFDLLLGTSFFMPAVIESGTPLDHNGGSPILFQHLFWFFGHPEVYIVALPAFGLVSDVLSTHARKNIFGYRMMVWAIIAIGGLSFVVWAHHMYVSGMHPYFGFFFATTTLIIAVPTALKVYNWVLTLWEGDIRLNAPMYFAIGFIFTFIHGGLTGLFLGNVVIDLPLVGHLLCGRALPHGYGCITCASYLCCFVSLVSESFRSHVPRRYGESTLLDYFPRYLRNLLADALPWLLGSSASLLRNGIHRLYPRVCARLERSDHNRSINSRRSADSILYQHILELA